jgi:hypothetical protein
MNPMTPRAWMRSALLIALVVAVPVRADAETAVVASPAAEVRTAPHDVAPQLATLARGERVSVTDQAASGWRVVTLADGRRGYVEDAHLAVGAAAASIAAAPVQQAGAATPARTVRPRLARPFVVRPEVNFSMKNPGTGNLPSGQTFADASSLGVAVGCNVTEKLALEAGVGCGCGSSSVTVNNRTIDTAAGMTFLGGVRVAPLLSASGHHALTFAGGPYVITGGLIGTVPFVHGEAAYEYRGDFMTALLAVGGNVAMGSGRRQPDMGCGLFGGFPCSGTFDAGDVVSHFRLGVGATF